ncbi:hypothetical protein VP01_7215g1 [Puccinia sorghi]|uniref:Uncharacterized protein n=1 Tax=Puccinia sorghi TaxID=27349 RepID=A0A0L6UD75_9BASI|nr:hypothetical protein VP01_7215g1 [Puccinia sorghi]
MFHAFQLKSRNMTCLMALPKEIVMLNGAFWGWFTVSSSMTKSLFATWCTYSLLKNVVNTSLGRVRGAAPCLEVLYNQIHQAFLSTAGLLVVLVNWSLIPMHVKIQFAYLQLEKAYHALNPTHGHGSQWTPINNQLELLGKKSDEYLRESTNLWTRWCNLHKCSKHTTFPHPGRGEQCFSVAREGIFIHRQTKWSQ